MYKAIKIECIFELFRQKKDGRIASLVIQIANLKMANLFIKKKLVMNHTLHGCIKYNPICKIKQYFNCYKYSHVLVYCQKKKSARPI